MDYFVVNLINGTQLTFNKKCNNVDHGSGKMCMFQNIDKVNKCRTVLGLVPYERISSILMTRDIEDLYNDALETMKGES